MHWVKYKWPTNKKNTLFEVYSTWLAHYEEKDKTVTPAVLPQV